MKKIILLCTVCFMLLQTSCTQNGIDTHTPPKQQTDFVTNEVISDSEEADCENVFLQTDSLGPTLYLGNIYRIYEDEFRMFGEDKKNQNTATTLVYDFNGELLKTIVYDFSYASIYDTATLTKDKELILLKNDYNTGTFSLSLYDADGVFVKQSLPHKNPCAFYSNTAENSFRIFDDGSMAFFKDSVLLLFDDFNAEPMEYEIPYHITGIEKFDDGTYFIRGEYGQVDLQSDYLLFDPSTGEVTEFVLPQIDKKPRDLFIELGTTLKDSTRYYQTTLIYRNNEYYAGTPDGFFVYRDHTVTQLIDWSASYIDADALTVLDVRSDDCVLAKYSDQLTQENKIIFLYRTEERRTKTREICRIATLGLDSDHCRLLRSAVLQFNRESSDYKIELTDYTDAYDVNIHGIMNATEQNAVRQSAFENDLLSGVTYDAYLFPEQSQNRDMLAEKGLLADLSPYLDLENILGCVQSAYRTRDGIVAIPLFLQMSTLVTTEDILPSTNKLTRDVLYEIAAELDNEETLFAVNPYQNLKTVGLFDFLDTETKTCSYDTDAFTKYLDFLKKVNAGDYTDDTYERVHGVSHESDGHVYEYALTSKNALKTEHQDNVKFYEFALNSVNSISAMLLNFKEQDIHYCGYPSDRETMILLSSDVLLSLSSLSVSPDGVEAFLQYMLSDDIQTASAYLRNGLPVSRSAMEEVFPVGYIYYSSTPMVGPGTKADWYQTHTKALMLEYRYYEDIELTHSEYDITFLNVTEDDRNDFIRFLDSAVMKTNSDKVLADIISEELSYTESGARSAAETGKILQGRVNIYINE